MPPPTVTFQPDDLAVLDDGDEAQIVGEDVDIVVGRDRDDGLELSRQVGLAVDRLSSSASPLVVDLLALEPDLVIGPRPAAGDGR